MALKQNVPTKENPIEIPQIHFIHIKQDIPTNEHPINLCYVTYVDLDQVEVQEFTLPMVRPTNRLKAKTIEHVIELPQVAYVDVPQTRITVENVVAIPQIRYTMVKQILQTKEHDIHIPILHYTQIPIIGVIHIEQQKTIVDRIAITQEWQIEEECAPTKTHFLQMPQKDTGIRGTVVSED